jgi:hypothetical protein
MQKNLYILSKTFFQEFIQRICKDQNFNQIKKSLNNKVYSH